MRPSRLIALLALASLLLAGFGCATKHPDEDTIPQARPASWEGGIPGFSPGGPY